MKLNQQQKHRTSKEETTEVTETRAEAGPVAEPTETEAEAEAEAETVTGSKKQNLLNL